jgi:hypothetical protein
MAVADAAYAGAFFGGVLGAIVGGGIGLAFDFGMQGTVVEHCRPI